VSIGVNAGLELVDEFRCLCGMLGVGGNAAVAVGTGVRIRWGEFRQLVPLLANRNVSLIVRGRLCSS